MSYHRTSSPGSRRLAHPARLSEGYYAASATTPYPLPATTAYASPRASAERIVPISTTTFVPRDAYSGRPRRSTLTDHSRPTTVPPTIATTTTAPLHPRTRPAVIQSSHDRTHSPSSPHAYPSRAPDYYAIPATSHRDHSHKKLYSIDGGGKSRLVADIDINTSHGSSHRRHSIDRNADRHSSSHHRHKGYHLSASSTRKTDADQGFSYTDPAAMYRETEPRWRHRAGSVEATRPRPSSALVEPYPPRSSARESGPPTSRALDKFNDTAGRPAATREPPRSSNRLSYQESPYNNNDGYVSSSNRHSAAVHQDRTRDVYPREAERARPVQRYEDRSVERRGFGIRSGSQDRYNHNMNKGSSESFDAYYSDRDREHAPPRSDPRAYDYPKDSDRERDYRPRDRDRDRLRDDGYASERDRHHDRERRDRDRDRDRDVTPRDSGDSLTNTLLPAAATAAISGLGAMAAAAYGSDTTVKGRDREYDDRDRDRDRDRERDREREREHREREQEYERKQRDREKEHREREREKRERDMERERDVERDSEKERERRHDREARARDRPRERERDRPRQSSSSDSGQDKHRSSRRHRTLGNDNSPSREKDARFVPDDRQRVPESDHTNQHDERQRVPERERAPPAEPPTEIDPDEDYRRRMEKAQRDLGLHDNLDSDRERRTRETEPLPHRPPPPAAATNVDYPENTARENRVRIVEPPSDREDSQPVKGILKRPTQKFPEDPHPVREGVAPLKETVKDGIPAGARWTKIDRRLVNPLALEEAQERFEERLDFVIVLRVLTKDEIQKLADKTLAIREARSYGDEDHERRERREHRRRERERERRERDEYEDHDSEDEYTPRAPRMLEAPLDGQEPAADFVRDHERRKDRERNREREPAYASGAL